MPPLTPQNLHLNEEVTLLRNWVKTQQTQGKIHREWEFDYDRWQKLIISYENFILSSTFQQWIEKDWEDLIFVLARDNEAQLFGDIIAENYDLLIATAKRVILSNEPDAKWQIAQLLGEISKSAETETLLLKLVTDKDEYVSRRALISLSKIKSTHTEELAIVAWKTNHEHQRIAALHALNDIKSSRLKLYLKLAIKDGRTYLLQNVTEIECSLE